MRKLTQLIFGLNEKDTYQVPSWIIGNIICHCEVPTKNRPFANQLVRDGNCCLGHLYIAISGGFPIRFGLY